MVKGCKRVVRGGLWAAGAGVMLLALFVLADYLWPLPDPERVHSIVILSEDRTPLRAFADTKGVWRYPVTLDEVSPLYVQALLEYEDHWFYYHPGINLLSLMRAAGQWLRHGKVVSGGSTLTMQVARILEPHNRDLAGKLRQMFRALQLEWHYSKPQILTFYLNLAPFGGPIEGVQTASYAWLHKPARQLSHAEAALLAILPQAPSRLRPDRNPALAQQFRDKVLKRMAVRGIWPENTVQEAMTEPVLASRFRQPLLAPLFAQRLKGRALLDQVSRLRTALDSNMQWAVENVVRNRLASLPPKASVGVLVVENASGYVRAYAGSADFASRARAGQVDMVQALRSPGSTLKPFLYGMALDDGLIHSASLLSDVPLRVEGYAPRNFFRDFSGPVSAEEALQQSLNVPAVDLLQRLTPAGFAARLQGGGVALVLPEHTEPNLSIILGGAGTRLEDLVRGFTALARGGMSIAPRFVPDDPVVERRMVSPGAAWIVADVLRHIAPPEGAINTRQIAWKTGTSYGFRDAWAIGTDNQYTVGIWTGRPDGTPLPGRMGAYAAGPILFDVFRALPKVVSSVAQTTRLRPPEVSLVDICWPLGTRAETTLPEHCHVRHQAWVLDDHVPPTLPNREQAAWSAGIRTYWINPLTGLRVRADCDTPSRQVREYAQWPVEVQPWLPAGLLDKMKLPSWDAGCPATLALQAESGLKIRHLDATTRLYLPPPSAGQAQAGVSIDLMADGGQGARTWLINGEVAGVDATSQGLRHAFTQAGDYEVTVLDIAGAVDKVNIQVISGPP